MENFDPDNPSQELIHICHDHARRHLNPIIDWTTEEVWEFIHKYDVPYCCLYDEGFKRLGCIGCPMGTVAHRKMEFERYPKYKQAYIHAFDRMIENRNRGGIQITESQEKNSQKHGSHSQAECSKLIEADIEIHDKKIVPVPKWKNSSTGEEVFDWWIR